MKTVKPSLFKTYATAATMVFSSAAIALGLDQKFVQPVVDQIKADKNAENVTPKLK